MSMVKYPTYSNKPGYIFSNAIARVFQDESNSICAELNNGKVIAIKDNVKEDTLIDEIADAISKGEDIDLTEV